jgi:hypothetical protein
MMRKNPSNAAKIAGRIAGGIAIGAASLFLVLLGLARIDTRSAAEKEADAKQ